MYNILYNCISMISTYIIIIIIFLFNWKQLS